MFRLVATVMLVSLFSFMLPVVDVHAMSPSERIYDCWDERDSGELSNHCEVILCNWDYDSAALLEGRLGEGESDCGNEFVAWAKDNPLMIATPVLLAAGGVFLAVKKSSKKQ